MIVEKCGNRKSFWRCKRRAAKNEGSGVFLKFVRMFDFELADNIFMKKFN